MAKHFSFPRSTPLLGSAASTVMPRATAGSHLPPRGDSALLGTDPPPGDDLARSMEAHLTRLGRDAREIGTMAAVLAAEQAPALKATAKAASAKIGAYAQSAASEAGQLLSDRALRQSVWAAHRGKIIAGAAGGLLLIGAVWGLASHQATHIARTKIDALLAETRLGDSLTYRSISATPFGSVTIADIGLRDPSLPLKIGAITLSDLDVRDGQLLGAAIQLSALEFPLAAKARQSLFGGGYAGLAALGYRSVRLDATMSFHIDLTQGRLDLASKGDVADAGRWEVDASFGGITPNLLNALKSLAQGDGSSAPLALLLGGPIWGQAAHITLISYRLSADDRDFAARLRAVPDSDLPPDNTDQPAAAADFSAARLTTAGMQADDAKDAAAALRRFLGEGGKIVVQSHLDRPLPLFRPGALGAPSLGSPTGFLGATRSTVSD